MISERPTDLIKQIAALPPSTPRPWYQRFTERKFLVPVLLILAMIVGVATKTIPFGWEVISGIVALAWGWMHGEVKMDLARIPVPEVPGMADDAVRALQKLALMLAELDDKNPATASSSPSTPATAPPAPTVIVGG